MLVHRDKVTGIDRLFVSVGVHGVFSGVYDPTFPGKIRWDSASETGPVPIRPLAIIEANGDLIYSADRSVFRRIDGPAPRYQKINDLSDLREGASAAYSPVGGIRGMTAIANPAGTGQSIVFVWAPGNRSRGCIMRLDRVTTDGYERRQEICLDKLVSQYLDGSPVPYVLAAYNRFLAVTDPSTGATHHLIGAEAWIPANGSRRLSRTTKAASMPEPCTRSGMTPLTTGLARSTGLSTSRLLRWSPHALTPYRPSPRTVARSFTSAAMTAISSAARIRRGYFERTLRMRYANARRDGERCKGLRLPCGHRMRQLRHRPTSAENEA
jgi:hypothetical protein